MLTRAAGGFRSFLALPFTAQSTPGEPCPCCTGCAFASLGASLTRPLTSTGCPFTAVPLVPFTADGI